MRNMLSTSYILHTLHYPLCAASTIRTPPHAVPVQTTRIYITDQWVAGRYGAADGQTVHLDGYVQPAYRRA